MDNPYIEYINKQNNTYSSYIRKAKNVKQAAGKHTELECRYLQAAADIKADIIRYLSVKGTSGEYKEKHERDLEILNSEISKIYMEINPQKYRQVKGTPNKSSTPDTSGQENTEDEINTNSWHKEKPSFGFEKVSGMEKLKEKLKDCLIDAKMEELSEYLNIRPLNSFFFVGPPGCGKTYIVQAFVKELMEQDYDYISLNGSDIISKYVGDAEKIVSTIFDEAIKSAPCIVFIDEIDGVCKNRSIQALPEYAASITTSFLTGYNKIHSANKKIFFIGATNYPQKVDSAMLDRVEVVMVDLPDLKAREYAFEQHFGKILSLERGFLYEKMAVVTEGFNYRDIDRLVEIIKHDIFKELSRTYSAHEAIVILKNGEFKLTEKRFMSAFRHFTPSNKSDIISDINEWLGKLESFNQYRDDETADSFEKFDLDKEFSDVDDIISGKMQAIKNVDVSIENIYDSIGGEETNEYKETGLIVATSLHAVSVDEVKGFVSVEFEIENKHSDKVLAAIDGYNFICTRNGTNYVFNFLPNDDRKKYTVRVSDEDGFVDEFTIDLSKPLSNNGDFDL